MHIYVHVYVEVCEAADYIRSKYPIVDDFPPEKKIPRQITPHYPPTSPRHPPLPRTPLRSTVRHAYPTSVPGVSDDWFAEHMLPEGAHNHALDWTVMFLNRDKSGLDEDWPPFQDGDSDSGKSDRATSKV